MNIDKQIVSIELDEVEVSLGNRMGDIMHNNSYNNEKFISTKENRAMGFKGEIAFSKYLNRFDSTFYENKLRDFSESDMPNPDHGIDIRLSDNILIDVKTISFGSSVFYNLASNTSCSDATHYVIVRQGFKENVYDIIGYVSKKRFVETSPKNNFRQGKLNYSFPVHFSYPILNLISEVYF